MFARELAERLKGTNVTVTSCHPGKVNITKVFITIIYISFSVEMHAHCFFVNFILTLCDLFENLIGIKVL